MPRRPRSLLFLPALVFALGACAGRGAAALEPRAALGPPLVSSGFSSAPSLQAPVPVFDDAAALARALAAVDPERIRADLHFLSDDALAGRDTPSRELRLAARYLRSRAASIGLLPGAEQGWFDDYEMLSQRVEPEQVELLARLGERTLALEYGVDFALHSGELQRGRWEGRLVHGGRGHTDDLEGLDLSGAWVLCRDEGVSRTRRLRNVAATEALGLLLAPDPDDDPERTAARLRSYATRAARLGLRWPPAPEDEREPDPEDLLPAARLGEAAAARLLAGVPRDAKGQPRLGPIPGAELTLAVAGSDGVPLENVCAFWPGRDPELTREVVIVSAHYDHVGVDAEGRVFNGADDNASGTSGLLALAEGLVAHGPFRRSVMLVWVSGEEKGLFGSRAWAEEAWLPPVASSGEARRAVCDINLDMIGRNAPGFLEYTPTEEHEAFNGLSRLVLELAPREGFDEIVSADKDWRRSDHAMFARYLEIPVVYISAGEHEDYHKVTDTPDKIDTHKTARFMRLVLRMIDALDGGPIE